MTDARADRTVGLKRDHAMRAPAVSAWSDAEPRSAPARMVRITRLETALDNMSQGLCMFDAAARLVICNRRYYEIFGIAAGALQPGMTQEDVCVVLVQRGCYPVEVTVETILSGTQEALRNGGGKPLFRTLADGRSLAILYRPLPDGGWVSTFEDITERRRSEARIAYLARHDPLTDLANARALRSDGKALLGPGPRTAFMAVHYIDLDRFKFINDTYGHDIGDALLRCVADRLRAIAPRTARIGRLGGDEFAILQRTASPGAALILARRIVAGLSTPYDLQVGAVEVGVSVGLTLREGLVADIEPLLQEADLALRAAKSAGRGTVSLFEPAMSEAAFKRRALEADLHAALAGDQFEIHYQPLVDIDDHAIVGVEALLRWRHPERGMVPPASFIPFAEEIGFIVPLGEWVLRQACREAVEWIGQVVLAVNVSCVQMRHQGFAVNVLAILAETGFPPARLEIEITESALLDESDTIMANLHHLRAAGIRFAMDDFGTGYSSLSYLRRFHFDKIKIDRSFMQDAEVSADALAIIRAVAGLGTSLGVTTLVEGVETSAQLDLARSEGVQQAQGFYLSRPQPRAVIAELLRTGIPLDARDDAGSLPSAAPEVVPG